MGEQTYYEQCLEAYKELEEKSKNLEDLIAFLLSSEVGRQVAGLEEAQLPEGIGIFVLNDIQKKYFRDAYKMFQEIKNQTESIILEQEEDYKKFLQEQEEEESAKVGARRLEYFTKNDDLKKISLPPGSIEETIFNSEDRFCDFSKIFKQVAEKIEDIQVVYYREIIEGYEKFMNEALATIIFPKLTNVFTTQCLHAVFTLKNEDTKEEEQKIMPTITPYLLSSYQNIREFLQEYSGEVYSGVTDDTKYERLRDVTEDLLFEYTEQYMFDLFFSILGKDFEIQIEEKRRDDLFAEVSNCLLPYNSMEALSQKYMEEIESLSIEEMFFYYELKDQRENYEFCVIDEDGFNEEKKQIDLFLNSLKTKTPKEIIMFDGAQFYKFYVDSENRILNIDGEEVVETVKELIWEIGSDETSPATLFVHEILPIKGPDGIEQRKVSGLLIQEGKFYPITKESLKSSYESQEAAGAISDIKGLRFSEWYFKHIPTFSNYENDDDE